MKFGDGFLSSLSIICVAYSMNINLFETYRNMEVKNNKTGNLAVIYSLVISMGVYTIIGFLGVYTFGSSITDNVMANIASEATSWATYILQIFFLVVIGCHIPFLFFSGKEGMMRIVTEIMYK